MRDPTTMTTKQLIKYITDVDILLAVSGTPLLLALFLQPKSGVMEVKPCNQRNFFYQKLAVQSDLYYSAHYNYTVVPSENDANQREVYIPTITLWMYMTDLAKTVNHNKYHVYRCSCLITDSTVVLYNRK